MRSLRASLAIAWLLLPAVALGEEPRLATKAVLEGFQALESWRLGRARDIAAEAHRERPHDPLVLALMADMKLHLGDYTGAVETYRAARRSGASEALVMNEPVAEAARVATDGYEETVSEHFVIRYSPGRDEILVPYAIETLEAAYDRIGELIGWRPSIRVVVEIYPAASTLAQVSTLTQDEIKNSGTIALCRWNRLMVTTPRAVVFGYSWRDTLAHELTHLIIGGASKNSVPIWLHEGIAKYAETAWRGEPGLGISDDQIEALVLAAKKGTLIPFEKMHPSMAKLKSQEETSLAFSEVFSFIDFLLRAKGWEGMQRVLERMSEGATDAEAIEAVHGEKLDLLFKKWAKSVVQNPPRPRGGTARSDRRLVIKDRPDAPDDKLHGLSDETRRYARAADLLYARGRLKAAQKELEKAYAATRSPLLSAKLAMVALAAGDMASAERAAREAIQGTPDLAGPNVTLAEILVRSGKPDAAKAPLARAIDINPFDPRIHGLTIQMLGQNGDPEKLRQASLAVALLSGDLRPAIAPRGQGGLIEIGGVPFSRVFLRRAGDGRRIATGMVTPSSPIAVSPGQYELELLPPSGAPATHVVEVLRSADGSPQPITPGSPGS